MSTEGEKKGIEIESDREEKFCCFPKGQQGAFLTKLSGGLIHIRSLSPYPVGLPER